MDPGSRAPHLSGVTSIGSAATKKLVMPAIQKKPALLPSLRGTSAARRKQTPTSVFARSQHAVWATKQSSLASVFGRCERSESEAIQSYPKKKFVMPERRTPYPASRKINKALTNRYGIIIISCKRPHHQARR